MPNPTFASKRTVNIFALTHLIRTFVEKKRVVRFVSLFLISALLLPGIFIAPVREANASSGIRKVGPIAIPPEPFQFQYSLSDSDEAASLTATLLSEIPNPFNWSSISENSAVKDTLASVTNLAVGESSLFSLINPESKAIKPEPRMIAPEPKEAAVDPSTAPAMMTAAGTVTFDFDGDGKADVSRWHPSDNTFKVKLSGSSGQSVVTSLGNPASIPVPGDFDPEYIGVELAVFNAGTWTYWSDSAHTILCGTAGDIPMAGDYDGDGITDAAVFTPATRDWKIRKSSTGTFVTQNYGLLGDTPITGDFDGDGKTDKAVYRDEQWQPPTANDDGRRGVWHISRSTAGDLTAQYGRPTDIPVQGDFDADGVSDLAVYRPSEGIWYVAKITGSGIVQIAAEPWGNYADQPVPADYDGDGYADFAVWRPTNGVWYMRSSNPVNEGGSGCSSSGSGSGTIGEFGIQCWHDTLGSAGDTALPSAYTKQVGGTVTPSALASDRLAPINSTGGTNLYSQNFSWGTSLVSLPGRSGLNAGFGISYNSLVWLKHDSTMYFDPDMSNITPGFRFGFPTIEPAYYDSRGFWAYMMVTPSGSRVDFRQIAASSTYETGDSSYTQLVTTGASSPNAPVENITITVRTTDGTQMNYSWKGGAFRCSKILDRNGNFITIDHDVQGVLRSVTDTLGRVINIDYDGELYPTLVWQSWKSNNGQGGPGPNGNPQHKWAEFEYDTVVVNTDWDGEITAVAGPPNGTNLKVLKKIKYADQSYTLFHYNSYAQVRKVENWAADTAASSPLNYVRTNLDSLSSDQTDCPRFTHTYTSAANFNLNSSGQPQEVDVENTAPEDSAFEVPDITERTKMVTVTTAGHPDGLYTKLHFAGHDATALWKQGLPVATEDYTNSGRQRWTWTKWDQDSEIDVKTCAASSYNYVRNPRVVETQVGDNDNISNRKRSTIDYLLSGSPCMEGGSVNIAVFGLVAETAAYDTDLSTVLKRSATDYNLSSAYLSRRIIGLPSETRLYDGNNALMSKTTFAYDEGNFSDSSLQQTLPSNTAQRDNTNYGASFITGRGNLTSTTRHDVLSQSSAVTSSVKYNTAGAPVSQTDPVGRVTRIGYADSFNSSVSVPTYAYPTTMTDPAGNSLGDPAYSSTIKYRYDIGASVEANSPAPGGQTHGKTSKRVFDSLGRLQRDSIYVGTAEKTYSRYEYPTNGIQSKVYSTITDTNNSGGPDTADEVLSESWANGAGLIYKARTPHTFSSGATATWAATLTNYDKLGRITGQSIPTEVNSSWIPVNDDDRGTYNGQPIWLGNSTEYDWKGRVTRSVNSDGKDQLISYEGCGCAGGQITTVQGPLVPRDDMAGVTARRTQKTYADILGRNYKTEMLNWDGLVYKTVTSAFNGNDQPVSVIESDANNTESREATTEYDGFGRVKRTHRPGQDVGKFTTYAYTLDGKPQTITDARGAVKHFDYNGVGQVDSIEYESPPAVPIVYTEPTMTHAEGNVDGSIYKFLFRGLNIESNAVIKATISVMNGQTFTLDNIERSTANGEQILRLDISSTGLSTYLNDNPNAHFIMKIVNPDNKKTDSAVVQWGGGVAVSVSPPVFVPSYSVSTTPPVSFTYDNLGNRTQMTDGSGTVNYEYNSLGQMMAETRTFTETPPLTPLNTNAFRIEYAYGLSGQLASYKEPFGEIVSYSHDKAGRLNTVTGNRTVENVQLNYVTDAKYRAWGAAKQIDFFGGSTVTGGNTEINGFNNGLQVNDYVFTEGATSTHLQYGYFDDGRIKSSTYLSNPRIFGPQNLSRFDRSYEYDFLGRLKAAKTGAEAHGTPEPNPMNRPYRTTLEYNTFDEITTQNRLHYVSTFNSTFQYQNGRNVHEGGSRNIPGWDEQPSISTDSFFDADGRPLGDNGVLPNAFDAAGNRTSIIDFDEATAQGNISIKYDGDGEKIETNKPYYDYCNGNNQPPCEHWWRHIYILSSVLGQEIGDFGPRADGGVMERNSRIIANGKRIAERRIKFVGPVQEATFLQRADPSGVEVIDKIVHNVSWQISLWGDGGSGTVDPFGAGVGYENPYPPPREDPPTPEECQAVCECDPGEIGETPPQWFCDVEYDDQGDENTETGSVSDGSTYDHNGNKIKLKESEDGSCGGAYGERCSEDRDERENGKLVRTIIDANTGERTVITSTWSQDPNIEVTSGDTVRSYAGDGRWEHSITHGPNANPTPPVIPEMFRTEPESTLQSQTGPSQSCLDALGVVRAGLSAYNEALKARGDLERAVQNHVFVSENFRGSFSWAMLAAMAIRETGFRNMSEIGGGGGRGIFQITGHKLTQDIYDSVEKSAEWVLTNKIANSYSQSLVDTQGEAILWTLRNYNAGGGSQNGYKMSLQILKSGSISAKDWDRGTAYPGLNLKKAPIDVNKGNYVSSVLNLASNCFGYQAHHIIDY